MSTDEIPKNDPTPDENMKVEKLRKKWRKKQNSYYEKNREAWNEYQREYKRRRYAEDPEYREKLKEDAKTNRAKNKKKKSSVKKK